MTTGATPSVYSTKPYTRVALTRRVPSHLFYVRLRLAGFTRTILMSLIIFELQTVRDHTTKNRYRKLTNITKTSNQDSCEKMYWRKPLAVKDTFVTTLKKLTRAENKNNTPGVTHPTSSIMQNYCGVHSSLASWRLSAFC